ncbi:NADPH-dependent FMN reductase [Candidatus Termititenax persephonae]|uniref:NADPH-dependent FMN reductase n=1 Tax=Candidatus Termititenax persephonae TaxID=2218525 RepID=A0A388TGA8_9BACT|nr:NADPH-dependent FMN reductase [Candidatus Termititenax persephonae]
MKKFLPILFIMPFLIGIANAQTTIKQSMERSDKISKILVVYYSHTGNTREIAKQIQAAVGGDIFAIEPLKPYPSEYRKTTEQAKKEITAGFKPEIKSGVANIKDYDTVFIGSPCWWSTIAPPVATFLSKHDLSGQTIIPFMTHGGSGLGHSVSDITKLAPKATIKTGRAFYGSSAPSAKEDVEEWLKDMAK